MQKSEKALRCGAPCEVSVNGGSRMEEKGAADFRRWLRFFGNDYGEEAKMKYKNAGDILPAELLERLQEYVQAGYLYVPVKDEEHRSWGEVSGYRKELDRRNEEIIMAYRGGSSLEELAGRYHLSVYAIRKIIYQK